MRKLNFKDIFRLAAIIKKAKIRAELSALIASISAEKTVKTDKNGENAEKTDKNAENLTEKVGISFILMIIEAAPEVEEEIFELVASINGTDVEQAQNMTLEEIGAFWRKLSAENDLQSFFSSAVSSLT